LPLCVPFVGTTADYQRLTAVQTSSLDRRGLSGYGLGMTPNQIIAFNLKRARELRGLTQEQAAELLEPHLGVRWSKSSFSAAESSAAEGTRRRVFSADEIQAFADGFNLPPAWFFLSPDATADERLLELVAKQTELDIQQALAPVFATIDRARKALDGLEARTRGIAEAYARGSAEALADHLSEAQPPSLAASLARHKKKEKGDH